MAQWIVPGQPGLSGVSAINLAIRVPGSDSAKRSQLKSGAACLAKENQLSMRFAISRAALWTAVYLNGAAGQRAVNLVAVGTHLELADRLQKANTVAQRAGAWRRSSTSSLFFGAPVSLRATEKQKRDEPLNRPNLLGGDRSLHVHGPGDAGVKLTFQ